MILLLRLLGATLLLGIPFVMLFAAGDACLPLAFGSVAFAVLTIAPVAMICNNRNL